MGAYLRNLLFALAQVDRQNEYFLFSASWKDRFPVEKIPPLAKLSFRDRRLPVRLLNFLWQRWGRPPLDYFVGVQLDLAHSATPLILPTRGKKIITVHDLFFMDYPAQSGREAGRAFFRWAADSARRADGIITYSSFTKNDIVARFGVRPEKVRVIPLGLDPRFLDEVPASELEATRQLLNLPRAFLLFVGAQEPRKNLTGLLEALKIIHLRGRPIPLVLVGPAGPDSERIRRNAVALGLETSLIMTGYLPERDVRHVYRLATAFILPSLCEGFGLPLVEAMASGVPIAASLTSVIPEVCRKAAVYFCPEDPEDMAEKILLAWENEPVRQDLIAKGKKRALDFSWLKAAAETLELYQSCGLT